MFERGGKIAAAAAKEHFKRNRPWIADPALKSCAKGDAPQSSYPSGHATMGYAFAVVLARIVPEKSKAIFDRADFARIASQLATSQGRFVLSINDVPEIREIFSAFTIEEVSTTYTIAAKAGAGKPVGELLISRL